MNSDALARGLAVLLGLATALVLPGCEEVLPARDDPQGILHAGLQASEGYVTVSPERHITGAGYLTVRFWSTHNEVLQAEADMRADVEIWLKERPDLKAFVSIGPADLSTPWVLRGTKAVLPPDSVAVFVRQWTHTTLDGTPFWEYFRLSPRVTSHGTPFCQSEPLRFVARASIRLFKQVAPIHTPEIEWTLTYDVFGIQCN